MIDCPDCDGDGYPCPTCGGDDPTCAECQGAGQPCETCGGSGEVEIPHCPKLLVTGDIHQLLRFCRLADEGNGLPVAGGTGDQTDSFLSALDRVRGERRRCEEEQAEDRAKRER